MSTNDVFSRIWAIYEAGDLLAMCAWYGRGSTLPPRPLTVKDD